MQDEVSIASNAPQEPQVGHMVFDFKHRSSAFIIPFIEKSSNEKNISKDIYERNGVKIQCPAIANSNECEELNLQSKNSKKKGGHRTYIKGKQKMILVQWVSLHRSNPYPTAEEKQELSRETGLSIQQINTWFVNTRRRDLTDTKAHFHAVLHVPGFGYQNFQFYSTGYPIFNQLPLNMLPMAIPQHQYQFIPNSLDR